MFIQPCAVWPTERTIPFFVLVVLGIQLNVLLAVFNFVPIPPLDGSKVASFGLPGDLGERYDRVMEPYGFMILLVLLITRDPSATSSWRPSRTGSSRNPLQGWCR